VKARTFFVASVVTLLMLTGSRPAYAQAHYDFTVPFDFVANGRTFTAGQYTLAPNENETVLTLTPKDSKVSPVVMLVETRLAEHKPLNEPEIVFDKLNGKAYVSELLVPGDEGYLLLVTKGKHTHESLKGANVKS
jgi:hypothetical protein